MEAPSPSVFGRVIVPPAPYEIPPTTGSAVNISGVSMSQ